MSRKTTNLIVALTSESFFVRKFIVATSLMVLTIALLLPVHAQTPFIRWDRSSYVPSDSGTLYLTFVNNDQTFVLQIKNITIYWPWAGFGPDGKWQGGSNTTQTYTNQYVPVKGGTFVASATFNIPSWFGGQNGNTNCGNGHTQFSTSFVACVFVGSNLSPNLDTTGDIFITLASPVYTPLSLVSAAIPIATLVVLAIATAFLALNWSSLRRLNKK